MADYKTPQWLLPNEKNLAYPASGDGITGSGLSEDRHSLYSMEFDGSSYIDLTNSLDLGTNSTISLWLKSSSGNLNNTIIGEDSYQFDYLFQIASASNEANIRIGSVVKIFTATEINDGNWNHWCIVRSGDSVELFINNVSKGTQTGYGTGTNTKFNVIGAEGDFQFPVNGQLDEIAAWNRTLSSSEITTLYNSGAPGNLMALSAKPYAYYPLGEQAQMGYSNWNFPNGSLQSHVVDFDGTDYIDLTQFDLSTVNTISLWLNISQISTGETLLGEPSNTFKQSVIIEGNIIYIKDVSNAFKGWNLSTSSEFSLNNWNHFAIVRSGSTVTFYINGVNQGSPDTSSGAFTASTKFRYLGADYPTNTKLVNGKISNVAIWNTDQSANIANIYNNGSPQSTYTVTPTSWWKLNAADSSYVYPWTMSITGAPDYTSSNDGCYISSGVLKWRDTGTPAAFTDTFDWYSKEITGANTNITISSTGGEWQGESSSIGLRLFYKIDGGSWVQFQEETHTGGYSPTAWTLTAPAAQSSSSSFQLKVVGFGGASSNSYVTLNDITVTADAGTLYTESFADADGTGFANGVYTPPPVDWTFIDSSGSNNGTSDTLPTSALVTSDLQFESPYSNYSLSFNGVDTKLSFSDITLASSYTLSAWVKRTSSSNNEFLFGNGATFGYGAYFNGTTAIYFKQDSGNTAFNNSAITTALARTDWVNWMFIKDSTAGTIAIYVDGALAQSVTSALGMTSINTIGGDGTAATSYIWNGNIDEVAIWDTALTQAQVNQVYNNGYPNDLTSLSPSQWWRLGEDAYFVSNNVTIPNKITGGQTGTGSGTQTAMLVGEAPGSYANGLGSSLDVFDRIGDAPKSTANSVSINMIPSNRISYPAGYVPTQVNNAFSMEFDGLNDYFSAPISALNSAYTFSFSLWAKKASASDVGAMMGHRISTYQGVWMNWYSDGIVYFSVRRGANESLTYALSFDSNWHHFAATFDNNAGKLYIDGTLVSSLTFTTTYAPATTGDDFRIGAIDSSTFGGGNIDEVAIFDYALSERQIKQDIYNGTTPGKTADLNNISNLTAPVAWYRMGD